MADLVIRGDTLTLRYPVADDAAALFQLGSDPQVTRYFSWGPYVRVVEAEAYIGTLAGRRDRGELLDFLMVHRDDGPVGVIGLNEFSIRDRRAMTGTWFGRQWWGTGLNREAKGLLAALAFGPLCLERIGAYASPSNARSVAALEKLGFVREGTLRGWHRHGDVVHDVHIFGMLRDDYEASPLAQVSADIEGDPPPACVAL